MPVATANGKKFTFPEGTTPDQMGEAIDHYFANQPATVADEEIPEPEGPGLLRRSAQTIGDAYEGTKERFADWDPTDLTEAHPGVMAFGKEVIPAVGSIATDVVGTAVRQLPYGDEVADAFNEGVGAIIETEPVQNALKAYQEFAEENPEVADRLEAGVNTGTAFIPGKVTLNKGGVSKRLDKANKSSFTSDRRSRTIEDLQPLRKQDRGALQLDERGRQIWESTPFDAQLADEVMKVKAYSPHKSNSWNQAKLREEAIKIREQMEESISKRGNPEVDLGALNSSFNKGIKNLRKDNRGIIQKDTLKRAQELSEVAAEYVAKSDGTALGILNARREFDRYIKNKTRGKGFDPEFTSALDAANGVIRDVLNEAVDTSVKGVDVRAQLQRQHLLLSAHERLLEKAWRERTTQMGRFIQYVENKTGLKFPTTPLAGAATVAAGAGAAAANPAVGATVAGLGTLFAGYKGARWLGTGEGKQWLIGLIKKVENDPLLSRHGVDKAMLVDMLEDLRNNPVEDDVK